MAYTPYAAGELPNLVNVTKRLDPDGNIAAIAEILSQANPIVEDIPMVEGNLPTGHQHTVRADIPSGTWRKLNYGVRPTKTKTAQVTDTIGMLEDYSEVDKEIANLNGNRAEFLLSEAKGKIEGLSQDMASALFYSDSNIAAQAHKFLGLTPRYSALGAPANKPTATTQSDYLLHCITAGGDTVDKETSMWLIGWSPETVFGIYPKGSMAGLQQNDLGEVTLFDNDGGRYQGYRTHFQWKMGLAVKDWRYIVRIANIDLTAGLAATSDDLLALYRCMIKAMYTVPQNGNVRYCFYCSPAVLAMLDIAATEKSNAALGYKDVFGKKMLSFRGIPMKGCHQILETEAVLT